MLRIPEGSRSKRSYTGCSINLNFVMFIILQLLMWMTLGRFKLLVIRFWHGSVCLWWQRRRPAWLCGWARDVGCPVGEEASAPPMDNKIPQFEFSFQTTNAFKQNALLVWSTWLHANPWPHSSFPCSGPKDLASILQAKRLFCSRETSKQLQHFILSPGIRACC